MNKLVEITNMNLIEQQHNANARVKELIGACERKNSVAMNHCQRQMYRDLMFERSHYLFGGSTISKRDIIVIFDALSNRETMLDRLSLCYSDLDDRCAQTIATSLLCNASIRKLDLEDNDIGSEGVEVIASVLSDNNTLRSLYLRGNPIGEKGADELATALICNETLEELTLDLCGVGNGGMKSILTALTLNDTLRSLSVYSADSLSARCIGVGIAAMRVNHKCCVSFQVSETTRSANEELQTLERLFVINRTCSSAEEAARKKLEEFGPFGRSMKLAEAKELAEAAAKAAAKAADDSDDDDDSSDSDSSSSSFSSSDSDSDSEDEQPAKKDDSSSDSSSDSDSSDSDSDSDSSDEEEDEKPAKKKEDKPAAAAKTAAKKDDSSDSSDSSDSDSDSDDDEDEKKADAKKAEAKADDGSSSSSSSDSNSSSNSNTLEDSAHPMQIQTTRNEEQSARLVEIEKENAEVIATAEFLRGEIATLKRGMDEMEPFTCSICYLRFTSDSGASIRNGHADRRPIVLPGSCGKTICMSCAEADREREQRKLAGRNQVMIPCMICKEKYHSIKHKFIINRTLLDAMEEIDRRSAKKARNSV